MKLIEATAGTGGAHAPRIEAEGASFAKQPCAGVLGPSRHPGLQMGFRV